MKNITVELEIIRIDNTDIVTTSGGPISTPDQPLS